VLKVWLLCTSQEYPDTWDHVISVHLKEETGIEAMEKLIVNWDVGKTNGGWHKRNEHHWETRNGAYQILLDERTTE